MDPYSLPPEFTIPEAREVRARFLRSNLDYIFFSTIDNKEREGRVIR